MNRSSILKLRPLAALVLVLVVMFGGALDAAACASPTSSFGQVAVSDDASPADERTDDQTGTDAVCFHGNCHHCHQGMHPNGQTSDPAAEIAAAIHFAVPPVPLNTAELLSFKEPPRA